MASIVLSTLNSRYSHAALGLRYLRANLGPLRAASVIREFVVRTPAGTIVEALLAEQPRIVGFGVYIWNVLQTAEVIRQLKARAPAVIVVIGGPEVSHEVDEQEICRLADYVITGWGDVTFARLAAALLDGPRPLMKVHAGEQAPLESLVLPYAEYTEDDLAHRTVYVEASRGCPFKCEFCLSALDKTAWPFPLAPLLADLRQLYALGARHFKFVDRTFNLKVATSARILEFFLGLIEARQGDPPFLHFELIPDHLPDALKALIARFPAGTLQFEIGIQTFDEATQRRISRRQDNGAAQENIAWLRASTRAHLHVDLIAGLPGEDLASFAAGFDRLVALGPHEIQVGILKRLRGAPIARHTAEFGMRYSAVPPYEVQETSAIDAGTMQRIARFARYWDLVANSGRFPGALPLVLDGSPFARFMDLADWLHSTEGRSHAIAAERLVEMLLGWLVEKGADRTMATQTLVADYRRSGARGRLPLGEVVSAPGAPRGRRRVAGRQARHLAP
ncbi:MAG TPA: DUF4080 domain-containing protein [Burkholderiaceae bacterium]|nr:DUF4080 domain-containing protein [Burkholderiaceae bacterium]